MKTLIHFGDNAYDGQMHMTMKQTNQAMDMTFTGKRIGDCAASFAFDSPKE